MLTTRFVVSITSSVILILGAGVGSGQNYPNKPVRILASETGGTIDVVSRLIAQGITGSLGQPIIVDNRATGVIQMEILKKVLPDGHTLLLAGGGLWSEPFLRYTPYDPIRDLSPITMVTGSPNVIAVYPLLPVNSVKELIDLAKARTGVLNYASSTTGTSSHLAAELFKTMAGIDIVRIPYKGTGEAFNALIAGEVQIMFPAAAGAASHIKAGKLRGLAVAAAQQSALAPGLPTVGASGLSGYEFGSNNAMFAPARTPPEIINRLNREVVRFLNQADVREKFFKLGVETRVGSPGELAAYAKSEMARMGKLIKDAGIRAE